MAAVTMEDLLQPYLHNSSQRKMVLISKGLSCLFGVGCMTVAALSSLLEWGVLQGSFTVMGVVSGPLLGIFILGIFIPATNKVGAYVGILVGYCVSVWLAIGSTLYPPSESIMGVLPSYASQCEAANITRNLIPEREHTASMLLQPDDNRGMLLNFYSISYLFFGATATCSVVLAGVIVSYLTGPTKRADIQRGLLRWDMGKQMESTLGQKSQQPMVLPQLVSSKDPKNSPLP